MENQKKQKQQLAAYEAAKKAQEEQQQHNEKSSNSEEEQQQEDQPSTQDQDDEAVISAEEDNEESEEGEEDDEEHLQELYQCLVGKKVNKSGMVVDRKSGAVLGRLVEGKLKRVFGKKVGEHGEIVNDKGKVVGRVEPIDEDESSSDEDNSDQGEPTVNNQDEEAISEAPVDQEQELGETPASNEDTNQEQDSTPTDTNEEQEAPAHDGESSAPGNGGDDKKDDTPGDGDNGKKKQDAPIDNKQEEVEGLAEETDKKAREIVPDQEQDATKEVSDPIEEGSDKTKDATDKTEKEVKDLDVGKDQAEQDIAAAVEERTIAAQEEGINPADKVDENSPVVKKSGKVLDADDNVVGHVDPRLASRFVGFKVDQEGNVINDDGEIVGIAEMLKPEEEPKPFNPNELVDEASPEVKKSGKVVDMEDNVVGSVDKNMAPKLAGFKMDLKGSVINHQGHIVTRADMIKPEEEAPKEEAPKYPNAAVDQDSPQVRKSGKVFDMDDELVGHVDKKDAAKWVGFKVDEEGNVHDEEGHVVGRAKTIKKEQEEKPKYPNSAVDEGSPEVRKSGKVVDMDDNVVGSVDKRMALKWNGFKVDDDGNVIDTEGHVVGTAEMAQPPEEEERPKYPNSAVDDSSPEVRKSGKAVDMDDNVVGTVGKGAAHKWAGFKVDWGGNIIDTEGHMVGKAEMSKQLTEEERKQQQDEEEYRRIADQISGAIQHSLDQIKPVLKNITDSTEAEEAKSEQDRNEEKLLETVRPLIEQGSSILNEAYGAIRGLDPSGKIAKKAQAKTFERKASPEEYHLADLLSQLTGEVTTTIDKAKKKIKNMPRAKKALSPLWNILQSPLLQILSAVGLLLSGVLGLVGQILNGLGLGGIINSILGGIGLNKILEGFGLGHALNLAGIKK